MLIYIYVFVLTVGTHVLETNGAEHSEGDSGEDEEQ